eukprot:463317_1
MSLSLISEEPIKGPGDVLLIGPKVASCEDVLEEALNRFKSVNVLLSDLHIIKIEQICDDEIKLKFIPLNDYSSNEEINKIVYQYSMTTGIDIYMYHKMILNKGAFSSILKADVLGSDAYEALVFAGAIIVIDGIGLVISQLIGARGIVIDAVIFIIFILIFIIFISMAFGFCIADLPMVTDIMIKISIVLNTIKKSKLLNTSNGCLIIAEQFQLQSQQKVPQPKYGEALLVLTLKKAEVNCKSRVAVVATIMDRNDIRHIKSLDSINELNNIFDKELGSDRKFDELYDGQAGGQVLNTTKGLSESPCEIYLNYLRYNKNEQLIAICNANQLCLIYESFDDKILGNEYRKQLYCDPGINTRNKIADCIIELNTQNYYGSSNEHVNVLFINRMFEWYDLNDMSNGKIICNAPQIMTILAEMESHSRALVYMKSGEYDKCIEICSIDSYEQNSDIIFKTYLRCVNAYQLIDKLKESKYEYVNPIQKDTLNLANSINESNSLLIRRNNIMLLFEQYNNLLLIETIHSCSICCEIEIRECICKNININGKARYLYGNEKELLDYIVNVLIVSSINVLLTNHTVIIIIDKIEHKCNEKQLYLKYIIELICPIFKLIIILLIQIINIITIGIYNLMSLRGIGIVIQSKSTNHTNIEIHELNEILNDLLYIELCGDDVECVNEYELNEYG